MLAFLSALDLGCALFQNGFSWMMMAAMKKAVGCAI
jgi:hypothetical protein